VSDTSADRDRDADALALSETGLYPACELPDLDVPDAWCLNGAARWAKQDGIPVLVCADHADALDRAASHASGAV
jgi:uncharacterized protein (DUF2237 family)